MTEIDLKKQDDIQIKLYFQNVPVSQYELLINVQCIPIE